MNILVAGGCGYIGYHLIRQLKKQNHNVVVVDYRCKSSKFAKFFEKNVQIYAEDYSNAAKIQEIIKKEHIELIIQAAGHSMVQESVVAPLKYFMNNASGNTFLLEAALLEGVKKFIYISSAAVFGQPTKLPISNDTVRNPINALGTCQVFAENMLESVRIAHGISYAVVRAPNLVGLNSDDHEYFLQNNGTSLFTNLFDLALCKRENIEIYGTNYDTVDHTCERDFLHIDDFCDAVVKTIDRLSVRHSKQIFNIGSGRAYSVKEVIKMCEKVFKKSLKIIESGPRFGDPARVVFDPYEARQTLDWRQKHESLEKILEDTWNLLKK